MEQSAVRDYFYVQEKTENVFLIVDDEIHPTLLWILVIFDIVLSNCFGTLALVYGNFKAVKSWR